MGSRSKVVVAVVAGLLGTGLVLAPSASAAPPKKSITIYQGSLAQATCTATPAGNNLALTGQAKSWVLATGGSVQCRVNSGAWTTSIPLEGGMTAGSAPVAATAGAASATGAYTLCIHVHIDYFDLDPRNFYWDQTSCV